MKLFSIKVIQIIMLLGVLASLGFNISQVNANTNSTPIITTIDRNIDIPFSVTTQEIGVARTQKVNLNTSAFETMAQNLFTDKAHKANSPIPDFSRSGTGCDFRSNRSHDSLRLHHVWKFE